MSGNYDLRSLIKLENKTAEAVAKVAIKHLSPLKQKVKSITFDNDLEFAEHELLNKNLESTFQKEQF
ncbi:transposase [Xenorhabdus sp. PB62.4]|nr:transposase [Xenorhabdus sp. PB62.4]